MAYLRSPEFAKKAALTRQRSAQRIPLWWRPSNYRWPFDDPAHAAGSDDEKMAVFRRVRDEIRRVFTAYADGRRDQCKAASKS